MAQVMVSTVVTAAPKEVWALVRDFNALPRWFPFIASSKLNEGDVPGMIGAERTLEARSGGTVRERLLALSDPDMRLSFQTFAGADLTLNYVGHMHVRPITRGGGSFFEFRGTFDAANGDIEKASEWLLRQIFEPVLARFEELFGRQP